jgi:hypothetical protein
MNRRAHSVVAIVLCGAMAPVLAASAASDLDHPKPSHGVALDRNVADGRVAAPEEKRDRERRDQEKWERDPMVFTARDRAAVRSYYRDASDLVPKAAKHAGAAAAGPHKRLRQNGILPRGLQQRMEPLPEQLETQLHFLYFGYSRGMIGQDVVIVEDRSQRIMDIIRDVTGRR